MDQELRRVVSVNVSLASKLASGVRWGDRSPFSEDLKYFKDFEKEQIN